MFEGIKNEGMNSDDLTGLGNLCRSMGIQKKKGNPDDADRADLKG